MDDNNHPSKNETARTESPWTPDVPLTADDLLHLEQLMKAADPLPWQACDARGGKCICGNVWSVPLDELLMTGLFDDHQRPREAVAANAAYVAAVCSALPRLLATVRDLEARQRRPEDDRPRRVETGIAAPAQALLSEECGLWVAQGLERDIAAQGATPEQALERLRATARAEAQLDELDGNAPLQNIPAYEYHATPLDQREEEMAQELVNAGWRLVIRGWADPTAPRLYITTRDAHEALLAARGSAT